MLLLIPLVVYLIMYRGDNGSSGGFKDGFLRGVEDASRAIQGKTDLKQASPDMECKIKCGSFEGITETYRYNWCFGIGDSSLTKLGRACCTS